MRQLAAARHPDLLVGIGGADDAGVYRITPDLALVQTVDFFTPIVDEAYDWGRVAAANALSDVYAMGGTPLTALQLAAWPRKGLPLDLLSEVFAGGAAVLESAGCVIVGGHSIDDNEPKYGMAVTGTVHPDEIVTNAGAKPGDRLFLTKPLGTGIISTAIKRGTATPSQRDTAVETMATLNAAAAAAMTRVGVTAATDVTGFGLLWHLHEMLVGAAVSAAIDADAVPLLDGVLALIESGTVPGGTERNLAAASGFTDLAGVDRSRQIALADAQTSGGLLMTVPPALAPALEAALAAEGVSTIAQIGEIVPRSTADGPQSRIHVR